MTEVEPPRLVEVEVPVTLDGMRADRVVAMLADVSRRQAAELIAEGQVRLDGEVLAVGRAPLVAGGRLLVALPGDGDGPTVKAEEHVAFSVVFEDADVAVVDKPAGLVVHPGAGNAEGTLVGGLLARYPELAQLVEGGVCAADRPGIVHRLDKGTSGLLAVARSVEAYESLVEQLATRSMRRRYLALVEGDVADAQGEIDAPIGRSTRTPTKMTVAAGGKPARTRYRVRQRLTEEAKGGGSRPMTLLELSLESGRTHQIRVHLAAIGHPVVGDIRYGRADPARRLATGRFFLHAFSLAFVHPQRGEELTFTSPLPPDLEGYLVGQGEREVEL